MEMTMRGHIAFQVGKHFCRYLALESYMLNQLQISKLPADLLGRILPPRMNVI